ncbi:MAG: glycoside hydrolase family 88 protein [Tannerella sp.]|jgi:rhamnogalacturonyl hydrolase YesR|nr:glycoside hydrolase family 88 protein [Tannerella sp.]
MKTLNQKPLRVILPIVALFLLSCDGEKREEKQDLNPSGILESASGQYLLMAEMLNGQRSFPKTYNSHTERLQTSASDWWCSGFYPGTLFYLYEETGKQALLDEGLRMLALLEKEQYNTDTHDIGFMMNCSFGNINRIAPQPAYREILLNSARSLVTRFSPVVGCIRSHNRRPDEYIVIVDNMMNLELLFEATRLSGDSSYHAVAVEHANTTLRNHFRPDNSLYHGINYNPETGEVANYQAGQGYSEQSAWARGQAWGLYGFTMAYRYTNDLRYADQAIKMAEFQFSHPNMPDDFVPYWDYDAPAIPDALRDVSAAAINCSALVELSLYTSGEMSEKYLGYARKILVSLSSGKYTATAGSNGGFLLKHSAGNIPSMTEVDVPLTYADYYYVEALRRFGLVSRGF